VEKIGDCLSKRFDARDDRDDQGDRRVITFPELGWALGMECVLLWIGLLHGEEDWQMR
jgi:hypothetical protein